MINYGRQSIDDTDIEAVLSVLMSDFVTQGPKIPEFEHELCNYTGAKYAVAVNSATSALHIACLALGVKKGDIVWTSPITFVASANCARYCGADVEFVDVEPETGLMSTQALKNKLIVAKKNKLLPKVVIPVHYSGQSCDMQAIHLLAQEYGFSVIEDASHALGATYRSKQVGSCSYSDICVFSFHPVKMITTGEGGAALTSSSQLANTMQLLRSHYTIKGESQDPWIYDIPDTGFNYRMTDIQAALGKSQLNRLDQFLERRNHIASYYNNYINHSEIRPIHQREGKSSYHLFPVLCRDAAQRRALYFWLKENGYQCQVHYIPIYQLSSYKDLSLDIKRNLSSSESFYQKVLSLPIFVDLKKQDMENIAKLINQFSG